MRRHQYVCSEEMHFGDKICKRGRDKYCRDSMSSYHREDSSLIYRTWFDLQICCLQWKSNTLIENFRRRVTNAFWNSRILEVELFNSINIILQTCSGWMLNALMVVKWVNQGKLSDCLMLVRDRDTGPKLTIQKLKLFHKKPTTNGSRFLDALASLRSKLRVTDRSNSDC